MNDVDTFRPQSKKGTQHGTVLTQQKTSNCYRKKNGVCCGYGGTHTPEHRPVEIIYTLLFCRYAKTLPQPLGRLHLKRSRTGAVILRPLFVQHHLLDRWSACSTSLSSSLPLIVAGGGVRKEHRRPTVVDHTMRISTTQQSARLLCWFRKSRGVSHSTPRSFS